MSHNLSKFFVGVADKLLYYLRPFRLEVDTLIKLNEVVSVGRLKKRCIPPDHLPGRSKS